MSNNLQKLLKNSKDQKLIGEAFEYAKKIYGDKKRSSGENYIDHALNVALILSDMGLDQTTVIAGLLHDVADTSNATSKRDILETVKNKFGQDLAQIVEQSSNLNKIYYFTRGSLAQEKSLTKENVENLRKMFFAIAKDLRVILIDLASRIDGMQNIGKLPEKMRADYATETMQIFAPVANRLGLGEVKTKLEDLSFAYLQPDEFKWLQENLKEKYEERKKYLEKSIPHVKKILKAERIAYLDISYRAKSYWSTYRKLLTHDMDFEKIHDLVALKIIVKDVSHCYKALGIVHKYFTPISPEKIKDYIAKPKQNGYKSLHTTVFLDKTRTSEIQIRTEEMEKEAEHGVCAHWSYKEKINLKKTGESFNWTKEIPKFRETFNIDFFSDQVFTFTPKGDIIVLPKGGTPVDFAYAIHSDVGDHCESAKIDGKIITLNQPLKNGDVVEIITNKKRTPSQDWLRFVKTGFAKSHIRKLITSIPASLFSVPSYVTKKLVELSEKSKKRTEEKAQIKKSGPPQIYLAGQKGMMVNLAKCCNPKNGDQVKAYLTKYRAAVLHKDSCDNLKKLSSVFPEKVIDASWN